MNKNQTSPINLTFQLIKPLVNLTMHLYSPLAHFISRTTFNTINFIRNRQTIFTPHLISNIISVRFSNQLPVNTIRKLSSGVNLITKRICIPTSLKRVRILLTSPSLRFQTLKTLTYQFKIRNYKWKWKSASPYV